MVDLKDLIKIQKNKCLESKRVRYSQNFKFNYNRNHNLIISPLTQISRTIHLIWHLLFQNQQWKRQNNVWNMFNVNNNKDARTRSITSSQFFIVNFQHIWYIFTPSSLIFIDCFRILGQKVVIFQDFFRTFEANFRTILGHLTKLDKLLSKFRIRFSC